MVPVPMIPHRTRRRSSATLIEVSQSSISRQRMQASHVTPAPTAQTVSALQGEIYPSEFPLYSRSVAVNTSA
eukprot:849806-Prymnesium_polylepis.3